MDCGNPAPPSSFPVDCHPPTPSGCGGNVWRLRKIFSPGGRTISSHPGPFHWGPRSRMPERYHYDFPGDGRGCSGHCDFCAWTEEGIFSNRKLAKRSCHDRGSKRKCASFPALAGGRCGVPMIYDCGMRIAECEIKNPQSAIRNPQSAIRNPQSNMIYYFYNLKGGKTDGPVTPYF